MSRRRHFKPRSIILLSGGLDSVVNTAIAKRRTHPILALTFDYGQRSSTEEIRAARSVAYYYRIPHRAMRLPWLAQITETSLVNTRKSLPRLRKSELDRLGPAKRSARAVWVPNRNGVFINIAAAFAEQWKADLIVTGFNVEEAVTFPDNSAVYVQNVNRALRFSTMQQPRVISFTQTMRKTAIARVARRLRVPLELVWSCYRGGSKMCGRCESCMRLKRALTC